MAAGDSTSSASSPPAETQNQDVYVFLSWQFSQMLLFIAVAVGEVNVCEDSIIAPCREYEGWPEVAGLKGGKGAN